MKKLGIPRLLALVPVFGMLALLAPASTGGANPAAQFQQPWHWPLAGDVQILEPFDGPVQNWLPGHRGVDLAAQSGITVLAPQQGAVSFRGTVVDRPVVVIDHGHGLKTSVEPVTSDLGVGDWVGARAVIGQVASGAHCDARCLHWGVRLSGEYIDPALLIEDLRPSILLPLR